MKQFNFGEVGRLPRSKILELELRYLSKLVSDTRSAQMNSFREYIESLLVPDFRGVAFSSTETQHEFGLAVFHAPSLQYGSLLALILGLLEAEFAVLVKHMDAQRNWRDPEKKGLSLGDLRGSGVRRSRKYLEHVHDIDLSRVDDDDNWRWILEAQKLRDCVLHNQLRIPENMQAGLRTYFAGEEGVRFLDTTTPIDFTLHADFVISAFSRMTHVLCAGMRAAQFLDEQEERQLIEMDWNL